MVASEELTEAFNNALQTLPGQEKPAAGTLEDKLAAAEQALSNALATAQTLFSDGYRQDLGKDNTSFS
jgi:hypothetical protein